MNIKKGLHFFQMDLNTNPQDDDQMCVGDDLQLPCVGDAQNTCPAAGWTDPVQEDPPSVEVLSSGVIARAPIPVDQAEKLEIAVGAEEGTYFVELMRKRLQHICYMQNNWLLRACNKKKPKYVQTQKKLLRFSELMLGLFRTHFGEQSTILADAPTRRYVRGGSALPKEKKK